ncbi:hypothetical protein [Vibrio harveyi]|uniref:hypothetical protein n=1 Tax=Vibrio harveyi TaxID=669 RepID=UPI00238037D2|nr:hypothetical protein [Vibrio harveyi]
MTICIKGKELNFAKKLYVEVTNHAFKTKTTFQQFPWLEESFNALFKVISDINPNFLELLNDNQEEIAEKDLEDYAKIKRIIELNIEILIRLDSKLLYATKSFQAIFTRHKHSKVILEAYPELNDQYQAMLQGADDLGLKYKDIHAQLMLEEQEAYFSKHLELIVDLASKVTFSAMTKKERRLNCKEIKRLLKEDEAESDIVFDENTHLNEQLNLIMDHKPNWNKSLLVEKLNLPAKSFEETVVLLNKTPKGGANKTFCCSLAVNMIVLMAIANPDQQYNVALVTADINQGLRKIYDDIFMESDILPSNLKLILITEEYVDYKPTEEKLINNAINTLVLEGERLERHIEENTLQIENTDLGNIFYVEVNQDDEEEKDLVKLDYLLFDIAANIDALETKNGLFMNYITPCSVFDGVSVENATESVAINAKDVYKRVEQYLINEGKSALRHDVLDEIEKVRAMSYTEIANADFARKEMIKETSAAAKHTFVYSNRVDSKHQQEFKEDIIPKLEKVEKDYGIKNEVLNIPKFNFNHYENAGILFVMPKDDLEYIKSLKGETLIRKAFEEQEEFYPVLQQFVDILV